MLQAFVYFEPSRLVLLQLSDSRRVLAGMLEPCLPLHRNSLVGVLVVRHRRFDGSFGTARTPQLSLKVAVSLQVFPYESWSPETVLEQCLSQAHAALKTCDVISSSSREIRTACHARQ